MKHRSTRGMRSHRHSRRERGIRILDRTIGGQNRTTRENLENGANRASAISRTNENEYGCEIRNPRDSLQAPRILHRFRSRRIILDKRTCAYVVPLSPRANAITKRIRKIKLISANKSGGNVASPPRRAIRLLTRRF